MTYEYRCKKCGHEWETEQKITESAQKECPRCGEQAAQRLVSGSGAFSLVGQGWFRTGGY